MNLITLGHLACEVRTRKGITQEALAQRTGVNRSYISQFETGRKNIRWTSLSKLIEGLDTTAEEFFRENADHNN